ncbi:histidine kinase N-terminal 7TM domain-containing diguanylate cyclase [Planococcus sp. YIM B11945]|uniref:histidine kinase N-terminal 7TM domain-containing diguanylate cyclase n=1 Tax=Planococcus sp. YIM B11945 TaxID=3435410 RepID=UPI003D7D6012
MTSQLTAYISLICTSGVLNLYLCFYVFGKRHNYRNIAHFFAFYTASIAVYCFAAAFGLTATTLWQMKFWTVIQYIGMPASAPLGLLFIMQYLGMKVTKKTVMALLAIPAISLFMVATNDFHHLHYRVFEIDPILGAPYIHQEIGSWYAVHGISVFASMFVAFLLLLSHWKETAKVYRPQLLALLFGQFVPMLTAFLYLVGFTPPGIDPVPMVLWLTSLLYLWAISSSKLFAIMPVAKNTIFNNINDGVMVLDDGYQLIEFNQASQSNFPKLTKAMFGMEFSEVWLELTGTAFPLNLETVELHQETQLTLDHSGRIFRIRVSPLAQARNTTGILIIFTDVTEVTTLQRKLENHAYFDELTQVSNRRSFLLQCTMDFEAARQESAPFAALLMDIDYFKRVNDTYGHHIGDQVLVHVAKVCESQLGSGQLFARYGGEEFVLALKSDVQAAAALGNQLRLALESRPLTIEEGEITVTLSLGVAEAAAGDTVYQLLNKADKALYEAKEEGRNRVKVYAETADLINKD